MKLKLLDLFIAVSKYGIAGLIIQCVLFTVLFAENSSAQIKSIKEVSVRLRSGHQSVKSLIKDIESQTPFRFIYVDNDIQVNQRLELGNLNVSVYDALVGVSKKTNLKFRQINESIYIGKDVENVDNFIPGEIQQAITITGKVTSSEDHQGLPGVNVVIQGTTQGTVTDVDGNYKIDIPSAETALIFSSVGYTRQEIEVGSRSVIDVVMAPDVAQLQEIVVVGYGTQKKINLTGSVESISSKDFAYKPVGQTSMALQGVAPGVTVTQNSGQPGHDGGVIRIRGIGTIGDANPLVLVDGVEYDLNDIDPNEIENISILKDAASAAIYGSRAANGVILITTKRANKDKFTISYRNYLGWQEATDLPKKVNGYDHMVMIDQAFRNVGQAEPFSQQYIDNYKTGAPSDEYPETNWQDVLLKDRAFQQNHYLSINGGGEKSSILGTISYLSQDGLPINNNYKRVNIRLNSDVHLHDNLSMNFDLFLRGDDDSNAGQPWYFLIRYPQNLAGKNENGTWGVGWDGTNMWADLEDGGMAHTIGNNAIINMKMNWEPVQDLKFSVQIAPEINYSHYKSFSKHVDLFYPDGTIINPTPFKASLTEKYNKSTTNNYRALISYEKKIGKQVIDLMGGWEAIDYRNQWIQGYRDEYPLENYDVLDVGSTKNQMATGSAYEWSLMSYFGRLNYNFNERYLLEANMRIDGSSRFSDGYKYGFFPSVSAGWLVTEEPFMEDVTWLNYLKLRASWGRLGNQNIGDYPFASAISLGQDYVFNNNSPALGAALLDAANPEISWETSEMVNLGFDATFWKLNMTAEYYVKNTYDILLKLPIPQITGLNAPYQNAGTVRNKGWDLRLQYDDAVRNFHYSIGATLSDVKNEVINLVGTGPYLSGSGYGAERIILEEGEPMNSLYGLESQGMFQSQEEIDNHAQQYGTVEPGDLKYKDQAADIDNDGIPDQPDGVINAADRVIIGNTIPRYTFSLDFSCNFKGFDFSAFFQGVGKCDGYLDEQATMAFYLGGTAYEWQKDYWTEDNKDATYPRLTFNHPNNEQVSSFWVKSAAYLRLKNLQVGYTLPKSMISKSFIEKARIYFSGQNLLTVDNFYDSFDPEAPYGNGSYYPMVKVFSFGVDCTF